jgi:NAD(P)H dehydrogenase (quinone)
MLTFAPSVNLKNRKMKKILVTGATGHLGSTVIETLLKQMLPNDISIITRKKEKREEFKTKGFNAFIGNYEDVAALKKAMSGVDTVLLISSGDQGDRMQEHKNVVDTARKMGVKNIAYTSRCLSNRSTLANKLMVEHFETEDYIKASGLNYIFFRNILYMDTIPQFIGGNMALEKGIFLPAGDGKVSFALRSDMGEAMANVLLNEGFDNQIYNFTGDTLYSFYDIASVLSELSGKTVTYNPVETAAYEGIMKQRNLSDSVIDKIVNFITDIKNNQEAEIHSDLKKYIGRKPTSLKEGLKMLFEL